MALHGLCDVRLVDFDEWPEFFQDMYTDIEQECNRYGEVVEVKIDEAAPMGSAWVRFVAPSCAKACQEGMHGRWFAGRKVVAELHKNEVWAGD